MESLVIDKDVTISAFEESRKEEKIEIAKKLIGILEESVIAEKTGLLLEDIKKLKELL